MEIRPSFIEFKALSKKGNLIPVYSEFLADTETPVSVYLKIKEKDFSYLLESAASAKGWGRYSFIGYEPFVKISFYKDRVELEENSNKRIFKETKDPLHTLRKLLKSFQLATNQEFSPFQGGLVGYFNYDLIRKWEEINDLVPEDLEYPESLFIISKRLIIFDHLTHRIRVVAFVYLKDKEDLFRVYKKTCKEIDKTILELKKHIPLYMHDNRVSISKVNSNFKKEDFEKIVLKAKDYIVNGDIIQVVLSQRFKGDIYGDDFIIYRNLRSINPSPYMFYLNFGKLKLIGSSPEILVRLIDDKIQLRPIAGTRPRGKDKITDQALSMELMSDPKERAEHIMLVDLGRNDIGKVAVAGSVKVPRLMEIERYSHVMHIVSRVEGKLRPDMDSFDLFMSVFPAGTVTGAPKVRAMEIINELEPSPRGPYAGAVGYFGFNGNMDFCITIRTIVIKENRIFIQAGAGIVYDSSPSKEYEETLKKASCLFEAIKEKEDIR